MDLRHEAVQEKSELSSNFEEIKNQTKRTANNAAKAFELSAKALASASKGQASMGDLLEAIEGIRVSSENISKIIKTIDEIAMQTNLLALNASVEAAHAGQYGAGFMVVAEEVRNLAGKCKKAANQTKELILESMEKVKIGVQTAKNSEAEINFVIDNVQNVNDVAQEIAKTAADRLAAVEKTEADVLNLESRVRVLSQAEQNSLVRNAPDHARESLPKPPPGQAIKRTETPKPMLTRRELQKPIPSKPSVLPAPRKPEPLNPLPKRSEPTVAAAVVKEPPKPFALRQVAQKTDAQNASKAPEPHKPANKPISTPPSPKSNRKVEVPSGAHVYDRKDFGKY